MRSENRSLRVALTISALLHGSFVLLAQFKLMSVENKIRDIEVNYIKSEAAVDAQLIKQLPRRSIDLREKKLSPEDIIRAREELKKSTNVSKAKNLAPQIFNKNKIFNKYSEFLKNKPPMPKPDVISIKKKIALTPVELNKIDNPSYVSYYQIVREKIRRCAYQNYSSEETGEVYVSFLIASDGNLRQVKIIEEKSSGSSYLERIAVKSVQDASSFPSFPKDLSYKELSFNVIISFEIE